VYILAFLPRMPQLGENDSYHLYHLIFIDVTQN